VPRHVHPGSDDAAGGLQTHETVPGRGLKESRMKKKHKQKLSRAIVKREVDLPDALVLIPKDDLKVALQQYARTVDPPLLDEDIELLEKLRADLEPNEKPEEEEEDDEPEPDAQGGEDGTEPEPDQGEGGDHSAGLSPSVLKRLARALLNLSGIPKRIATFRTRLSARTDALESIIEFVTSTWKSGKQVLASVREAILAAMKWLKVDQIVVAVERMTKSPNRLVRTAGFALACILGVLIGVMFVAVFALSIFNRPTKVLNEFADELGIELPV
ncbi:MAG: hypothetical protein ACT4PT_10460, partial [Methanobacteriota archaeon]